MLSKRDNYLSHLDNCLSRLDNNEKHAYKQKYNR